MVFHCNLFHVEDIYSTKLDMEISGIIVDMNLWCLHNTTASRSLILQFVYFLKGHTSISVPVQIY